MPGLVGLITAQPRAWAEAQLAIMVESIRHESFYRTGTWVDESLGVYVGWAVRKNSFCDGLPILNEQGDVCLVLAGEVYSEPGALRQLKERGHSFGADEPSYLVHLYEEDQSFPAGLNGMFQGLLTDGIRGTATLFNDRTGMHHVCYHESKDAFYFAAEAKAILAVRPDLRTPDPQRVGELVACSCVLENRTIFKDIHILPSASAWTFRNASLERKGTYFDPGEWERQTPLDTEAYYQQLRDILNRNLPLYFAGREQVGMTLTGGLDTRVIMACHQSDPGLLPTYTFGSMYRDNYDVRIGRHVAEVCRQPHQVITVGDEFLRNFARYAERSVYLTEGTVDVYRASDLYVSEKARQIAPVKVVGTYGSEIVRQAVMFKPMPPPKGVFRPDMLSYVQQAGDTYASLRKQNPVTFAAFRQSPWYHHGILALEQSQLSVRSPFLDNDFVRTVFRAPKAYNSHGDDIRLRLIGGNPALASFRTDRGVGGSSGCVTSAWARNFLEFSFKAEYAYDYGMPQWLTRMDHYLSGLHLERLFLGRHKLLHFRLWYRDQLAEYVRQMLLDSRTLSRPYLERKNVEGMVRGHLKGDRNYTTAIHKLLTLELVHRLFLDSQ
jgi:asparagine synthase (glutamine-hydrolysing)